MRGFDSIAGAPWLAQPGPARILAALAGGGHRALFVGGCVRNTLLAMPVADVDIATDAPPERVIALVGAAGLRAVPTGLAHGTVTVVAEGAGYEVTTFRRDVQTDGRRALVAFSTDLAEDAARRDFTMNALYAEAGGQVVDPLGGLPDLAARRLRFVGRAQDRIREDYLRILRFFRFYAWYGDPAGGPDPEGLAACAALADGLGQLSRERVGHEMRRLLAAPDPAPAVAAMAAAGVLARVIPGADPAALAPLIHGEASLAGEGDGAEGAEGAGATAPFAWLRRLAALGGDTEDLRLSRDEERGLAARRAALADPDGPAVLAYRHGASAARDALLIRAAGGLPLPEGWRADLARGAGAVFPVRAADLAPLGGPALGARLRHLEERWLQSDLRAGRDSLLAAKP